MSLGYRLEKALQNEDIYPVFHYGEFAAQHGVRSLSNIVHFEAKNFFDGLDFKVEKILQHVDACISEYGESYVFL